MKSPDDTMKQCPFCHQCWYGVSHPCGTAGRVVTAGECCADCDGNGLALIPDHTGGKRPFIAVCGTRGCEAGQRIAKVLMAIARGEPVGFADAGMRGFMYDRPCGVIEPMPAKRRTT